MTAFHTSIAIDASPAEVWALVTDGARWPDWNPTIKRVEGPIAPDEKVTVYTTASSARAFPLRVTTFVPNERMVWAGGMPLGLFKGERTCTLTDQGARGVAFTMHEAFSGLLAPLITRSIPDLQPSFEAFAAALKRRAEQQGEP